MISSSVRTAGPGINFSRMARRREEVEARWRANLNAVMARVRSWGWVRKAGLMIGASAVLEEEMVMLPLLKVARRPIARVAKLWTPSLVPMAKGALDKDTQRSVKLLYQCRFPNRPWSKSERTH